MTTLVISYANLYVTVFWVRDNFEYQKNLGELLNCSPVCDVDILRNAINFNREGMSVINKIQCELKRYSIRWEAHVSQITLEFPSLLYAP